MKRCRCGFSAGRSASTPRCGSPSRQRASPATATPFVSCGDALDGLEVAGRGGREAGLDDVDVEPRELARDLDLLARRSARRRAPARRRAGSCRRCVPGTSVVIGCLLARWRSVPGPPRPGPGPAWSPRPGRATPSGSAGAAPTCSIWWSRSAWRRRANSAPPESYSAIQLSAKRPLWMSESTSFIDCLTPSVTRGPLT